MTCKNAQTTTSCSKWCTYLCKKSMPTIHVDLHVTIYQYLQPSKAKSVARYIQRRFGEVSLYSWSQVLQVLIQLLHYIQVIFFFPFLVKYSIVKLETSHTRWILPPNVSILWYALHGYGDFSNSYFVNL